MIEIFIEEQIAKRKAELLSYFLKTSVARHLVLYDRTELADSQNVFRFVYEGIGCANMIIQLKASFDEVLDSMENKVCTYRICPCKAEEGWQFYYEVTFPKEYGEETCYVYFKEYEEDDGIEEEELIFITGTSKVTYPVRYFSAENKLTECFIYFIENEDFSVDMELLDRAWHILCETTLSGRHSQKAYRRSARAAGIAMKMEDMDQFRELAKSPHLKKRWSYYWKRKGQEEPDLEQVIDTMANFFTQIVATLEKGEILIADWMPQIGRFL